MRNLRLLILPVKVLEATCQALICPKFVQGVFPKASLQPQISEQQGIAEVKLVPREGLEPSTN